MLTRGLTQLRAVVSSRGLTQTAIADAVGVTQSMVSRWLDAECRPDTVARLAIQRLYGIDPTAWLTAKERDAAFGKRRGQKAG